MESRWSGRVPIGEDHIVSVPARQIRLRYSADAVTVYQAHARRLRCRQW